MRAIAVVLCHFLLLVIGSREADAAGGACDAPDEVWRLQASADLWSRLDGSALSVPLTIVAIGSSSTKGVGASRPKAAYPAQLAIMLQAAMPGRAVEVVNKGIGGETVAANLARFEHDVLALDPDLVIWQVGTNDALRRINPSAVAEGLREGIEAIREAGATPILMEPQYLPERADDATLDATIEAIREVAAATTTPLIRRFDLMRFWLESERFTDDTLLSPDRLHMTDASYFCLADRVAAGLLTAVTPERH